MFKNWSRGGGINISDAFLMLFGFSEVGAIANISDAFLIFVCRVKKKIKHPLTGGVVDLFDKLGDIESDLAQWCTY